MKRCVIFDVDGTLLDTERLYMRAWQEAGRLFGYEIGKDALLKTRAVSVPLAQKIFRAACGESFPYDEVRRERVRLAEAWIESAPAESLLMPGAREALAALREKGYALAVATSTAYEVTKRHLTRAGLWDFFSAAAGGDQVRQGKPAPDIFLLAAERAGVSPGSCLVAGDTPADAKGGAAAGMTVALIPDQVPADDETRRLSFRVLGGLSELPEAAAAWEKALSANGND